MSNISTHYKATLFFSLSTVSIGQKQSSRVCGFFSSKALLQHCVMCGWMWMTGAVKQHCCTAIHMLSAAEQALQHSHSHINFHQGSQFLSFLLKPIPPSSSASLATYRFSVRRENFCKAISMIAFLGKGACFLFFPQSYMKICPWHNDRRLLMSKALFGHKINNVLNVNFSVFSHLLALFS